MRYATPRTNGLTSHPKDEAVVKCFALKGHKCHGTQNKDGIYFCASNSFNKRNHSHLNVHILILGIVWKMTHVLPKCSCSMHWLRLVASKLHVKVASCDKALRLPHTICITARKSPKEWYKVISTHFSYVHYVQCSPIL